MRARTGAISIAAAISNATDFDSRLRGVSRERRPSHIANLVAVKLARPMHGGAVVPDEAARIDGAGPVQSFFQITLPLLRPTSFFVLLVSTVAAVCGSQTFDLVYIMTKGGPANSTSLAIFYIYQQAFQFNEYGYAAAMASVLVVVLMAITVLMFLLTQGGRFTYE